MGDTTNFEVVLTPGTLFLTILKGGGGRGVKKGDSPLKGGGHKKVYPVLRWGHKKFLAHIFPISSPLN